MSAKTERITIDLATAIKNLGTPKTEAFDSKAVVTRVDNANGIAWVHFDGGEPETPAAMTVNAKAGDTVQVRVSGGVAFLVGNASNPPTDDTFAYMANENARIAKEIADEAIVDAERARDAADQAEASANEARQSANEANASATRANTAANNALTQLSVVEDVVGVLSWITDHGSYALSEDTEVTPGKFYFSRTGSGTQADPYVYNIVTNPTGNPSVNGYYELDSIDEAVSNYVSSHLALTNAGLWVTKDNNGYKILVANNGVTIYDPSGNPVSTFGESITFASSRPQYIGGEDAYIIFYDGDDDGLPDSIRIGGSKVFIGSNKRLSDVLTSLDISTTQTPTGADITIGGQTVSLTNGTDGVDGEDATVIEIDSSQGILFKSDSFSTVLNVTIRKGSLSITNAAAMRAEYGIGSYLQWYWRKMDYDDWSVISAADSHLSNDGFSFTVTPADVDEKIVFKCDLIV